MTPAKILTPNATHNRPPIPAPSRQNQPDDGKSERGDIRAWLYLWFLAGTLLVITLLAGFIREGMFIDGIVYAAIAKNLSLNQGNVWDPFYSTTHFAHFYEHPPLVFYLQSGLFRLLGPDSPAERVYNALVALVQFALLAFYWLTQGPRMSSASATLPWSSISWLLCLWLLIPLNYLYTSNMLECTLTLFTTLAGLMLLVNTRSISGTLITTACSACAMMVAFLCNGPCAFFPLAIPCLKALILQKNNHHQALAESVLLAGLLGLAFVIFYALVPDAWINTTHYLHEQLAASLSGDRGTRFTGFAHMHIFVLYMRAYWLVAGITLLVNLATKQPLPAMMTRYGLLLLAVSLIASLPVGISPRQAFNYIMPSAPFATLAAMIWSYPATLRLMQRLSSSRFLQTKALWLCCSMFIISLIGVSVQRMYAKPNLMLRNILQLRHDLPQHSVVSVDSELFYAWYTGAYFARFSSISITPEPGQRHYLGFKNHPLPAAYRAITRTHDDYFQLGRLRRTLQIPTNQLR